MRVVAPSVGGGFGSKLNVYAEELLCVALAPQHHLPVRWNEERTENALATTQGRGQIQDIELAADENGKLTAIRIRLLGDMGAYLQLVTPGIPLLGRVPVRRRLRPAGGLRLQLHLGVHHDDPDRRLSRRRPPRGDLRHRAGHGRAWRRRSAIDPLELRRRNYVQKDQFPYTAFSGLTYDSGDHLAASDHAAELADYDGVRARQATQNVAGATKRLGIGVSSYFEMCGLAPSRVLASLNYIAGGWEHATVRVLPTNKVQVVTGATPHGQGHETCWSMIVADKLGVAPGGRRRPPLRHRDQPARARHLRLAVAGRRWRRHRHGVRPGDRQGPEDRRPPARVRRGGPRLRRRRRSR